MQMPVIRLSRWQQLRLWCGLKRRQLTLCACSAAGAGLLCWLQPEQPFWWLLGQISLGLLLVLLVVALSD
jgi:hypothetical protein